MRIALDAMGGDDAPAAMVAGAVDYAREYLTTRCCWWGASQTLLTIYNTMMAPT